MAARTKQTSESWETSENVLFLTVILLVTVIAYAPLVGGVWELGSHTTQALNAFALLLVACVDSLLSVLKTDPFKPTINPHGLLLFGLSCFALAVSSFTLVWPFAVLGLCLNAGALLSFCFGRRGAVAFYPALAGFGVMVAMLVMVPRVDGLLRVLAGSVSSWMLPILGIRSDMIIQQEPFQVILVVEKGARVFNVATECNGFGILISSLMLSLILSLRRRIPWYMTILVVALSALSGLAFNVIRIVMIALCSLKTDFPYAVIHEGMGTLVYLFAMAAICALNLMVAKRRS